MTDSEKRAPRSGSGWVLPNRSSPSSALMESYPVTSHAGSPAGVVARSIDAPLAMIPPPCPAADRCVEGQHNLGEPQRSSGVRLAAFVDHRARASSDLAEFGRCR